MRKKNTHGGGAGTNKNGLRFERETSLDEALAAKGYAVDNGNVYCGEEPVAVSAPKHKLYTRILGPRGVDWHDRISKKLLPDEALFNQKNHTLYIIEKKFQETSGSVDEKLQTCGFKKSEYEKLIAGTDIGQVQYGYVLCDYFKQDKYRDTLEYIEQSGCWYEFNEVPIARLGLPEAE